MQTSDAAPLDELTPFHKLDGIPVVGRWRSKLSSALLELHNGCGQADLISLRRFDRYVSANRVEFQAAAQKGSRFSLSAPGVQHKYPVCSTLLLRRSTNQVSAALDLLLAAMVEVALEASDLERRQIGKMTTALRGALEQAPNSRLQLVLGLRSSLAEIHGCLQQEFAIAKIGEPTLGPHWRRFFGARIQAWLLRDRSRLINALAPSDLVPADYAPTTTIQCEIDGDPDDALEIPTAVTPEEDGGGTSGEDVGAEVPIIEEARAGAHALERASQGDLLSHPDWSMPVELIRKLAQDSVQIAQRHIENHEPREAEPYVALAVSFATGLRESDLPNIRWGPAPTGAAEKSRPPPGIDVSKPLMHWPIVHPPSPDKNPKPKPAMDKGSDMIEWPLPPTVHKLVLALNGNRPTVGTCVLPSFESGANLPLALRATIKRIVPSLHAGAGAARRAFASELARALGPDVAQLALADAFSHSVAQTYYSAPRVSAVTSTIRTIQESWFGESATVTDPEGFFGSRIVPNDDVSRQWPTTLHAKRRSIAHRKSGAASADGWIAHRNFLAASLCAATGHRPTRSIGDIAIHDIVPEYGLVILYDKQIDALRRVRIAATGALWVAELRDYLDRIVDLAANASEPPIAELAGRVLRGTAPLFSAPTPAGESFDSSMLVATMPVEFQPVRNHYRHRLNQQMLWRSVDPELRYAQMGWVISPAYFTADLSPNAATDLARYIGSTIDEILVDDGWFSANRRLAKWHWDGVPMPAMIDWDAIATEHTEHHQAEVKRLRETWRERGAETEIKILPRLASAISTVLPRLHLDVEKRCFSWAPEYRGREPVEIDAEHCELLLNIVRRQDERPFEALETAVTRVLLHRLLKKSHRQGMTAGVVPGRPVFSATADASPFLSGSGLAVRHADYIRTFLMDRIRAGTTRDQGIQTALSVLCFSPYRDVELTRAAVEAAAGAARAGNPGDWLRVPGRVDGHSQPMVLNGIAALLLAKRGKDAPTAHSPTTESINAWLKDHLPTEVVLSNGLTHLDAVAGTMRAAGRLELSGPERLLMIGANFSGAPIERCLALDDGWPVQTKEIADATQIEPPPSSVLAPETPAPPPRHSSDEIRQYKSQLLPLLNPKTLPKALEKESDSRYGLRSQQLDRLQDLRKKTGETSVIGLLIGFGIHLLRHGGKKGALREISVHTVITRFAADLLDVAGNRALLAMDATELRSLYRTILLCKTEAARAESVESLEAFQRYLEDVYQVAEVPFEELKQLAGARIRNPDPGILTDAEVDAICNVLDHELQQELEGVNVSPEFRRLAEMRLLLFILAEASGLRPASLHGLLLGDLYLLGEGRDFVHVHRTGSFGVVKTNTSVGFVPLEGKLWESRRSWVVEWLERERSRLADDRAWDVPLFARKPGSGRRFSDSMLKLHLGHLLRWVTNDNKARLYWCRKRRIRLRLARLAARDGMCLARDVHATLNVCGQAGIVTPLESYIGDPAVPMARSLREGRFSPRADILTATRLKPEPLDVEWGRKGGAHGARRMEIVFNRLSIATRQVPPERLTAPPVSSHRLGLLPAHIDMYARALRSYPDRELAALNVGLSIEQADASDLAAKELLALRGRVPWKIPGLQHPRVVMTTSRRLKGSSAIFKALEREPTCDLVRLSEIWAQRGFSHLVVDSKLLLTNEDEVHLVRRTFAELGLGDRQIIITGTGSDRAVNFIPALKANKKRGQSLASAIEWLLALVWIQQKVGAGRKED